ncbi:MAG: hypothetical protein K0S41_1189 [Anaerocolumna sp.]|jgi:putative peptide zinc metalloprotease protein|nr:hypothetical protein [Anaerocolumna sp.]
MADELENVLCISKYIYMKKMNENRYYLFNKKNKKSYEFGKTEATVLESMNTPLTFAALVQKNKDKMGTEQLKRFVDVLEKAGFLSTSVVKGANTITRIKLGLFNPSKKLNENSKIVKLVHFILCYLPYVFIAIGLLSLIHTHNNLFQILLSYTFSVKNVAIAAMIMFLSTIFHELGHMCMALYYGVPVPEVGFMFYWFAPCAYADVSTLHFIKEKRYKIQVLLAGVYVHLIAASIGMVLFAYEPGLIFISLPLIVINLSAVLLNLTFYLKLDGYFILTTMLEEPLLREKSIMFFLKSKSDEFKKENITNKFLYTACGFIAIAYIPALVSSIVLRLIPFLISITRNWF